MMVQLRVLPVLKQKIESNDGKGDEKMYGSIEAGGTKFVCAIGDEEMTIKERVSFPTTTPEETMALVIDFFKSMKTS